MTSVRAHACSRHAEAFQPTGQQYHVRPLPQMYKYPLGPYYFQEYKPYVMKAEVECVRA